MCKIAACGFGVGFTGADLRVWFGFDFVVLSLRFVVWVVRVGCGWCWFGFGCWVWFLAVVGCDLYFVGVCLCK